MQGAIIVIQSERAKFHQLDQQTKKWMRTVGKEEKGQGQHNTKFIW